MHDPLSGGIEFTHHKQSTLRQLEEYLEEAGLTPRAFKAWLWCVCCIHLQYKMQNLPLFLVFY